MEGAPKQKSTGVLCPGTDRLTSHLRIKEGHSILSLSVTFPFGSAALLLFHVWFLFAARMPIMRTEYSINVCWVNNQGVGYKGLSNVEHGLLLSPDWTSSHLFYLRASQNLFLKILRDQISPLNCKVVECVCVCWFPVGKSCVLLREILAIETETNKALVLRDFSGPWWC